MQTKKNTDTGAVRVPRVYGNRFATQEEQSDGTWIVWNHVTGLFISDGSGDPESGERHPRIYKTYSEARGDVVYLYQHYRALEG